MQKSTSSRPLHLSARDRKLVGKTCDRLRDLPGALPCCSCCRDLLVIIDSNGPFLMQRYRLPQCNVIRLPGRVKKNPWLAQGYLWRCRLRFEPKSHRIDKGENLELGSGRLRQPLVYASTSPRMPALFSPSIAQCSHSRSGSTSNTFAKLAFCSHYCQKMENSATLHVDTPVRLIGTMSCTLPCSAAVECVANALLTVYHLGQVVRN